MMEREVSVPRAKGAKAQKKSARRGLAVERYFTTKGVDPAEELAWETRTAQITGEGGSLIFEQKDVEFPKTWSQTATNVVGPEVLPRHARHAGARALGPPADRPRRRHDRRLGREGRLLRDARTTRDASAPSSRTSSPAEDGVQLAGLVQRRRRGAPAVLRLLHQLGRRLDGLDPRRSPRPRACSSSTAPAPARTSRRSAPRASTSAGGGTASGPVSFMRGFDAFAGVIKSRRQDPPRGEDGDPQHRPPGHRRLHRAARPTKRRRPGR